MAYTATVYTCIRLVSSCYLKKVQLQTLIRIDTTAFELYVQFQ